MGVVGFMQEQGPTTPTIMTKVTYKRARDGQWYWHVVPGNGRVVASAHGYARKSTARAAFKRAQYYMQVAVEWRR